MQKKVSKIKDMAKIETKNYRESLKKEKDNPQVLRYKIAHEGETAPMLFKGSGKWQSKSILWTKDAINQFCNRLQEKLKVKELAVIDKHSSSGAVVTIGDLFGAESVEENGKVAVYADVFLYNEQTNLKTCSPECYVELETKNGVDVVTNVISVDALSVSNDAPAFKEARQVGYAFANQVTPEQLRQVSLDTIKEALLLKRVKPSQIFSDEELFGVETRLDDGSVHVDGGDVSILRKFNEKISQIKKEFDVKMKSIADEKDALAGDAHSFNVINTRNKIVDNIKKSQKVPDENLSRYAEQKAALLSPKIGTDLEDFAAAHEKSILTDWKFLTDKGNNPIAEAGEGSELDTGGC